MQAEKMESTSNDLQQPAPENTWAAFHRVWPTALAVTPISMLFGVLAHQANWSVLEVLVVSLLGFTGSGQFALLPLASQGVGVVTMLLVAVSINCRYVPIGFLSASRLPRRFWPRFYLAHILGDEAYAVEKDGDSSRNVLVIRSAIFAAWVLSAVAGALAAGMIPPGLLDPAINLGFPASVVLLYLSFGQLRMRLADMGAKRRRQAAGFALCIVIAAAAIAMLGPTYFWIPSIAACTWLLWRIQA
jgi:predicted branched-subunit amino acid permease